MDDFSSQPQTLDQFKHFALQKLKMNKIENSRIEVDRLLEAHFQQGSAQLALRGESKLDPKDLEILIAKIERRSKGEPLAYVLGSQGFYKSDFFVQKGVLIPRPETELLVDWSLEVLKSLQYQNSFEFLELGSGSGCLGLSLAKELNLRSLKFSGLLVDHSKMAIETTNQNRKDLSLQDYIEVKKMDLMASGVSERVRALGGEKAWPLILGNPPYIDLKDQRVDPWVRKHEPAEALFSDEAGLAHIFQWILLSEKLLSPGGVYLFEIGCDQKEPVRGFIKNLQLEWVECRKDLAGLDRAIALRKPAKP